MWNIWGVKVNVLFPFAWCHMSLLSWWCSGICMNSWYKNKQEYNLLRNKCENSGHSLMIVLTAAVDLVSNCKLVGYRVNLESVTWFKNKKWLITFTNTFMIKIDQKYNDSWFGTNSRLHEINYLLPEMFLS